MKTLQHAGVAELEYATDSKSVALVDWGFESPLPHHRVVGRYLPGEGR